MEVNSLLAGLRQFGLSTLMVLTLAIATPAQGAEAVRQATAGESLVLAKTDKPITEAKAAKGTVVVAETPGPPKANLLVYQAPTTVTPTDDLVTYSDGTARSVQVKVLPDENTAGAYADSFKTLFVLFVVALLLESALATIFNWRPFVDYFNSRGVKTVISVAVAYLLVSIFDFDVVARLLRIYGQDLGFKSEKTGNGLPGRLLTALILAGGSSGVNNILVALQFRSVRTPEQLAPKPPPQHGWIAVRLVRDRAVGAVTVLLRTGGNDEVAGTISGTSKNSKLLRYFLRDSGRLPTAGGIPLPQGVSYEVLLEGVDATNMRIVSATPWGPHAIRSGAIVDIDLKL